MKKKSNLIEIWKKRIERGSINKLKNSKKRVTLFLKMALKVQIKKSKRRKLEGEAEVNKNNKRNLPRERVLEAKSSKSKLKAMKMTTLRKKKYQLVKKTPMNEN